LPRASRASRHVAAASWIESKAPERVEDLAVVIAYHYTAALDLARASGNTDQATELHAPALRFLTLAGERALGLDTTAALASFERALALTPEGHPQRAAALARFGEAAFQAGGYGEARYALEEAINAFQRSGDRRGAAQAMTTLNRVLGMLADPRRRALPAEALAVLEPLPPGPEHVAALTEAAANEALQGRHAAGIDYAEQALALAAQLGLPKPARALGYRGLARGQLGDRDGLADFREAIVLATEAGQGREVALLHNNYSSVLWPVEGPRVALEVLQAGIDFARARGLTEMTEGLIASTLDVLVETGEHEQALALASELATDLEASGSLFGLVVVRTVQSRILTLRGQASRVADRLDRLEATIRENGQIDMLVAGLGTAAIARAALAQPNHATTLLGEIDSAPGSRDTVHYPALLPAIVRTALTTNNPQLAHQLATGVEHHTPYHDHALAAATAALAEANGHHQAAADRYADAARRWQTFGVPTEEAFALLGHGRCLVALGQMTDAVQPLRLARDIFQELQAAPALAETDALLQQATAQLISAGLTPVVLDE
jgi:tetratricopeptide (TPR) repeat protein